MREIKTEDRPTCSCGRKMIIVEYSSYYETFNYFDCGYCEVDPDDYKADDYTRVILVKEREETEVKKDIEWAIKEIKGLETEPSQNYPHDEMIEKEIVLGILNQLKEPETLSPDWIGDNVEYAYYMTPKGTYSSAKAVIDPNKLENLLVPKQEKVMVDKEDAENIVDYKVMGWALSHLIDDYGEDARHDELLAKAWLAYPNIEVEEEQKYFAKIKGHENISSDDKYWNYCITDESLEIGDNNIHFDVLDEYMLSATKDEWENLGINDDNADFVKVEELEE